MAEEYKAIVDSFLSKIHGVRPRIGAIYLFGSRARGLAHPASDYDFLIVVPSRDRELKDKLYDAAVDVSLESDVDVSLKVVKQSDFERMKQLSAPFVENVLREGKKVG